MQPWRARDGHVREAVARQVRAVVVRPAVALRAAEAATDAPRREAAEPLTRGEAALGTACSLLAGLAGEACARADRADSDARVARPASAADAALDRAQRDARPRQEEACAQRAHSEELEELASGRLAGELAGCGRRQVHLVREARDRRLRRRTQAWLVAGVQPRRAGDREIGEAVARAASAPCALALGAAEATAGSSARQAAEPLARGRATLGTAASLLAGLARRSRCSRRVVLGEEQGLHGPPPQPMQPSTAPSETPVLVRNRPAPSDVAPSTLKSCRRDDRFARECAARRVRSI